MDERTANNISELTSKRRPLSAREAAAVLGVSDLAHYRERHPGQAHPPARLLRLIPPTRRERPAAGWIPAPLTTFIGRTREMAALLDLLRQPEVRLLTLTGPGGVGKTRLARAAATELEECFADGVTFVSLAPVRDPGLVPSIS